MPVNYSLAAINARLQSVVTSIDGAGIPGVLRLLDGSGNILSSVTLQLPSGTVSGGVLTFSGVPLTDLSAARSGTAVLARVDTGNGVTVISGLTVSQGGGTDVLLTPSNVITAGQAVSFQAAQITGN